MSMRELRFRAWDKAKARMLSNIGFHPHMCCFNEDYQSHEDGAYTLSPEFTNYVIMQYTGLNDKNGVPIFEGDIVRGVLYKDYSEHVGRILYDFNGYRIVTKEKSMPLDLPEKLTVIGNIHQHPELLK